MGQDSFLLVVMPAVAAAVVIMVVVVLAVMAVAVAVAHPILRLHLQDST